MERKTPETIEILSPAKNLFYAKEAIKCGADAVYIGAPKFSLRYEHFNSFEDIKELTDFAHKYWAKVYVPLNCLLYTDADVALAKDMINTLYEIGVDALIVQDIGILELDLPPVPIFLSTNAMCFTKEAAQFYEKVGVSRIVLPRELTFEEIKDITDNSSIELETFCYGFLCVGYSGNCYLSYAENLDKTKSRDKAKYLASNHGVCPERCMGNWTLRDTEGKIIRENDRLFNLRFLSLHNEIGRLFDIGINSFKIAGREKDLKHVKNSTAIFSGIADEIARKKGIKRLSSGRCILGFKPYLYKNFNKGFTDFFLNGRKKEMYSKYHLVGEYIGVAENYENNTFTINTDIKLSIGDKLRYKPAGDAVKTIEIISEENGRYHIKPIQDNLQGLELYRYFDAKGFEEVEKSVNYRVISVTLRTEENNGHYLITATDEDNNSITVHYPKGRTKTENLFKIEEDCEFVIDKIKGDLSIDDENNLKNIIFAELRKERETNRPKMHGQIIKNNTPYFKEELNCLVNVTNKFTEAFYKRHGVKKIDAGLETGIPLEDKRIFSSRYCLRNELDLCSKTKPEKMPPLPWFLEQIESCLKFKVEFDCSKCNMYLYLVNQEK